MNRMLCISFLLTACAVASAAVPSSLRSFDDYQVILERKPFGAPPDHSMEPERVVPIQESFAANMKLLGIFEEDGTFRVQIMDHKNATYFSLRYFPGDDLELAEREIEALTRAGDAESMAIAGELKDLVSENSYGSIHLDDVDYDKAEAVLSQDGVTVVLRMGDGEAAQVLNSAEREERTKQAAERRTSYAERRKARMAARAKPPEIPKPIYTGKALEEHLQNYQMEVLRQGLPPLPVQLTEDRDSQLVAEGVLPPVDREGYELNEDETDAEDPYYAEDEDAYYSEDEGDYTY